MPPESIPFEDKEVPIWTFTQLERLSKANLRQRAMNLRDQIGADRLMPLRLSSQPDALIRWLLVAQISLCEAVGIQLTMRELGAPKEDIEMEPGSYFGPKHGQDSSRPPTADPLPYPQREPPPYAPMQPTVPQYGQPPAAPYGLDPPPSSGRSQAKPQPTPNYGMGIVAQGMHAHDDAVAGAKAARLRNEGSFTLGGDPVDIGDAYPPSSHQYRAAPPAQQQYRPMSAQARPDTAASYTSNMSASDESALGFERNRAKNQGSFTFG